MVDYLKAYSANLENAIITPISDEFKKISKAIRSNCEAIYKMIESLDLEKLQEDVDAYFVWLESIGIFVVESQQIKGGDIGMMLIQPGKVRREDIRVAKDFAKNIKSYIEDIDAYLAPSGSDS